MTGLNSWIDESMHQNPEHSNGENMMPLDPDEWSIDPGIELVDEIAKGKDTFKHAEECLQALTYVTFDIKEQGGMSRALAKIVQEHLPEDVERRPLGYYTDFNSLTLLRESMEEISGGMWAAIAAATAALTAVIYKVYKWIAGKFGWGSDSGGSGGGGGGDSGEDSPASFSKNIEKAEEVNIKQEKELTDTKKDIDIINRAVHENAKEVAAAFSTGESAEDDEKTIEKRNKELEDAIKRQGDALLGALFVNKSSSAHFMRISETAFFRDIMQGNNGHFISKLLRLTQNITHGIVPFYIARMRSIENAVHHDIYNTGQGTPEEVMGQTDLVVATNRQFWTIEGKPAEANEGGMTIGEIRSAYFNEYEKLRTTIIENAEPLNPTKVFEALAELSKPDGIKDRMIKAMKRCNDLLAAGQKNLKKLEEKTGPSYRDHSPDGMKDTSVITTVRLLVSELKETILDLSQIMTLCTQYLQVLDNYQAATNDIYKIAIKDFYRKMGHMENLMNAMPHVKELYDEMERDNGGTLLQRLFKKKK